MTLSRRELLASLGVASASTVLWGAGCTAPARTVRRTDEVSGEVRTWLRDAVERLSAQFAAAHVLAVTRLRTTAVLDVLGAGVARVRRDGVVLVVFDRDGKRREVATSELTREGIDKAVRVLAGPQARAPRIGFPTPARSGSDAPRMQDAELVERVHEMARADRSITSRIVYAASSIDVDDATVWSISPKHDREQRLVRVRKRAVRAAWNGTRPVIGEVDRGWRGDVDAFQLDAAALEAATADALLLFTPGGFDEKQHVVILDPTLTAALVDVGARALLTLDAARRPELQSRLRISTQVASPLVTLVDDPTAAAAYGGYAFDDFGEPASRLTLLREGRVAARLSVGRVRRPGHVGIAEPTASHVRLVAGTEDHTALRDVGLLLEGAHGVVLDPSSDRVVLAAARAREIRNGVATGRVYADVELVGNMSELLARIDGIAANRVVVPFRDEVDGEPRWRSVDAPYVRTRGFVRARRRA